MADSVFQSISSSVLLNQESLYSDPYVKYLAAAGDPVKSADEFNRLYAGLVGTAASSGSKFGNAFEELQALLRANNYSKGKSATGIVDASDRTGLATAIQDALAMGQTDVIQFLTALSASGGRGGTKVKQQDTTRQFVSTVNRALQLKDLGDATRELTDAYMLAYNNAPTEEMITNFQKEWNKELRAQTPSTKSDAVTKSVPAYNKKKPIFTKNPVLTKNGKPKKDAKGNIIYQQKLDKDGNPMFEQLRNADGTLKYKKVTTTKEVTEGMGFTAEEQQAFMAEYIAANFPGDWDTKYIGGAAKNVYDAISEINRNNLEDVPTFQAMSPFILKMIGTGNSEVANTIFKKYVDDTRRRTASRFMSLAEELNAGNDAKPIVDKYIDLASQAMETYIDIDDPLMKTILNYKDEKGNYRLPNELEISNLFMNDPRMAFTAKSKNEAVNVAQSLANKLQIG